MDNRRDLADELAYIDHRAPEITPAWSTKGQRYDYDSQRYVPRTASFDVDEATETFKRAQWRYLQSPESLPSGKHFHIENTHNWSEVMEMAREAARSYDQRGGRLQHLLRKGGIAFGKSGDFTMAWVQLLPAGDYGSVVSGGIKLILTACSHMNDVRMAVLDTLEKLPDSLQTKEQFLNLYKGEAELLRTVEILYITLLKALESMLLWLEHKTTAHMFKAIFSQSSYEKETMARISNIENVSKQISSQIEFCFQSRVKGLEQHAEQNAQDASVIIKRTEHMEEVLEQLINKPNPCTELMFMLREVKNMVEWRKKDEEKRETTEKALLMVQEQLSRAATPVNVNVVQYVALPASPYTTLALTPSQLFTILHPSLNEHSAEIEFVLSEGSKLTNINSSRGTWLMRQSSFQTWFSSNQSQILLVDGHERKQPVTSLSYLVAVLSQGLQNDPQCVILSYFCRLHTDENNHNKDSIAVSIMRSLLGQLLVKNHVQFNTHSIDNYLVSWVKVSDLSALCAVFSTLIKTCAPTTIFILLDGISWLETYPQAEIDDLQRMFASFRSLVQELGAIKYGTRVHGRTSNVKILLTSPRPSTEFQQYFDEEACYSMPVAPAIAARRFFGDHVLVEREFMEQDN